MNLWKSVARENEERQANILKGYLARQVHQYLEKARGTNHADVYCTPFQNRRIQQHIQVAPSKSSHDPGDLVRRRRVEESSTRMVEPTKAACNRQQGV